MAVEDSNLTIVKTQDSGSDLLDAMSSDQNGPEAAQAFVASEFQALMANSSDNSDLTQANLTDLMTKNFEHQGVTYEGGLMEYLHSQGVFAGSTEGKGLDGASFDGNGYAGGATSDDGFGEEGGDTADSPGGAPEASSNDGFA